MCLVEPPLGTANKYSLMGDVAYLSGHVYPGTRIRVPLRKVLLLGLIKLVFMFARELL